MGTEIIARRCVDSAFANLEKVRKDPVPIGVCSETNAKCVCRYLSFEGVHNLKHNLLNVARVLLTCAVQLT